ncbi:MAG TPA: ATP-binding cassette domain-containing protein [Spirochaetota bacterium]
MIEVKDLTKYYGDFCAVKGVSFKVNDGEITGLLGPNGAGKTTTMRMITGYLVPNSGAVSVGGLSIADDSIELKKMIGYLPESAPLYGDMMVYDYLRFAAEVHRIENSEERIREMAELCGLIEVMHKNIGELSKGYKQRVGLAHAMIHDPKILILDEPTSGLDPNQIVEIRSLIREIGKKKTVILSTHILSEVEATCDRVIIINQGNIVADSLTSELRSSFGKLASIRVAVKEGSFDELSKLIKSIDGVESFVRADDSEGFVAGIAGAKKDVRGDIFRAVRDKGWTLFELAREQNTLETIFRELTTGGCNE